MAVKVDEHISTPLPLKPLQVPKSTWFEVKVKIFKMIFHFFPFPSVQISITDVEPAEAAC